MSISIFMDLSSQTGNSAYSRPFSDSPESDFFSRDCWKERFFPNDDEPKFSSFSTLYETNAPFDKNPENLSRQEKHCPCKSQVYDTLYKRYIKKPLLEHNRK